MLSISSVVVVLFMASVGFLLLLFKIKYKAAKWGCACLMVVSIGGGVVLGYFSTSLMTYQRLTQEQEVAEISFRWLKQDTFQALLQYPNDRRLHRYILQGELWQIDAVVIKWQGFANLLGMNAWYRLERISGRFSLPGLEQKMASAYRLNRPTNQPIWQWLHEYRQWIPWVDAIYGSATYLPMTDLARYKIFMTQSGLIARAIELKKNTTVLREL